MNERKLYEAPRIIHELELETRAGSYPKPPCPHDTFDTDC